MPEKFGEEATVDHWIARNGASRGYKGESVALTLRDRATRWIDCMGMKSNTASMTIKGLNYLKGARDKFQCIYSDGAEEIGQAADSIQAIHDQAIPENKGTNAIIERTNRHVQEGIRTLLNTSGLPNIFWTFAVRAFCLAANVTVGNGEKSPWHKRYG